MWELQFFRIINMIDQFKPCNQDELDDFYVLIKEMLDDLQVFIINELQDDDASTLITFALIAYCDEKIGLLSLERCFSYTPLQLAIFNITNAGNEYYNYIDMIISKEKYSEQVVFVYYFLLKHGFKGLHGASNGYNKINYLKRLRNIFKDKKVDKCYLSMSNNHIMSRNKKRSMFVRYFCAPLILFLTSFILVQYI